ncbi:MAG: penicillin acylase family protein [Gemmatimonadetes bacterium]|nr:penicillin acylase family protein [Gemmatimonadota bacterium]
MKRGLLCAVLASTLFACQPNTHEIARRVEIVRTEYGIPHILADDLEAMGFGLGYVQSEDYSVSIAVAMAGSRGPLARHLGEAELEGDFVARETHATAVEAFHQLDPRTQSVYRGFAEGVNHYIRLHPDEFPPWVTPDFIGPDALARDVQSWSRGDAARFRRNLATSSATAGAGPASAGITAGIGPASILPASASSATAESAVSASFLLDGSNAWAFHGSRTESGNTILLRNPHLRWDGDHDLLTRVSGLTYYEAHVRVPGVIDFYGDFRIGTAFGIIGGFNPRLGWATTNNYPTLSQVYRLRAHPTLNDHALLDGRPLPLEERTATVDYITEAGDTALETRTFWHTQHGPVIHRTEDDVYILKDPRDGEFRRGEQFLRMMMASDLDEWLGVMRMRAHPTSNFTYADADGNIAHYYNARLPLLPHPVTGDTAAFADSSDDIWSELVAWEDLPLYLNPPGGYVQQANDTPDYTNLNVPLDRDTVPPNLPEPRLRLRSQLSLELAAGGGLAGGNPELLTLEDVVALKHSPRMLIAERVMDDLLNAVRAALNGGGASDSGAARDPESAPGRGLAEALAVLAAWDRTASADSRGGVLFQRWAGEYFSGAPDSLHWRQPWDPARPATTPFGIRDQAAAVDALSAAADSLRNRGVPLDIPWGDIHRVIRGGVDVPVSGCPPTLGCFRALSFAPTDAATAAEDATPDREAAQTGVGYPRLAANRGDAWVLIVEFGETPRAYTVLAYGQTARSESPHYSDQAAIFASGRMKPVAWTAEEIERTAIRHYRPGR